MKIKLLKNCDVPMATYHTFCECCGPERQADMGQWYPEGEILDPADQYNEIDLEAHKDSFKFGEHYTIVEYP